MGLFDSIFGKDEPPTTPSAKGTEKPATLTPVNPSAINTPPVTLATPAVPAKVPKTHFEMAGPFIQRKEGFAPEAHLDTNGKYVIGFGQQSIDGKPVTKGMKITKQEAEIAFKAEYDRREAILNKYPNTKNMTPGLKARTMEGIWNGDPTQIERWPKTKAILSSTDPAELKKLDAELLTIRKGRINGELVVIPALEKRRKEAQEELKDE